jgi:SAM-dependent methyltransferase
MTIEERKARLRWDGPDRLRVGAADFLVALDGAQGTRATAERLILMKNKVMVDTFVEQAPDVVENIFDLGIFKGGSIAFYHELFLPKKLVGIELHPDRAKGLDEFLSVHSLGTSVRLYYGTNQRDVKALSRILLTEFGNQSLDLVVDDCSHKYEPAKASLNLLLPRLRPGGVYLVEDWGWAHWPGAHWQGSDHQYANELKPMSNLILELVMVAESRPGLISEVVIKHGAAYITRGPETEVEGGFDVSNAYLSAGRTILS